MFFQPLSITRIPLRLSFSSSKVKNKPFIKYFLAVVLRIWERLSPDKLTTIAKVTRHSQEASIQDLFNLFSIFFVFVSLLDKLCASCCCYHACTYWITFYSSSVGARASLLFKMVEIVDNFNLVSGAGSKPNLIFS